MLALTVVTAPSLPAVIAPSAIFGVVTASAASFGVVTVASAICGFG
jgi:hypothetical protein